MNRPALRPGRLAWWLAGLVAVALLVGLWRAGPAGGGGVQFTAAAGDPAQRRGALVDQVVFTEESNPGKVVGQIETGERQVLAQGVSNPTVYRQLRNSRRAGFDLSYGSSVELTLNPAGPELANGRLNPFAVPAIREALNWLVDRRYVADELYGGLAVPRVLPLSTAFPDYARLAATARQLELRYRHRPQHARQVIARELRALGAVQRDGRWHHGGEPVVITVLIRTEDTRRRVGDYVANLLDDLGLTAERLYRTAEQAAPLWLASDPAAGRWHIYTGGWVSTVINRDQAQNFADFYTPRGRPSPLWQAYQPAPEFDEVAQRLQRRDYASWEERQELMREALAQAMEDSVRIWLVDQLNLWPHAADVQLATDLAGGLAGARLWPYTLRYRDRVGGSMTIAAPTVLTDPWNPVAGTNWLYDMMIIRATQDAPLLPDPFTGLYWPQRIAAAQVTVVDTAPVRRSHDWLTLDTRPEIAVPEDAWIAWDVEANRFVTVGEAHPEGLTARTRTRLRYQDGYLERRWHDGAPVSVADLVIPYILQFVRADQASPLYDRSHAPTFATFERHFRGWRIVSREPLVVEVYSDQIFPDAETIVAARAPSTLPWHLLSLGVRAEVAGELAFSSDKADRRQITWLSLVSGPSLGVLDRHLEQARTEGYVPFRETLDPLLAEGEAEARYAALAGWRGQRGHYWVGDGPLYLHSVYPVEGALVMRHYPDFPDPGDKWLRFTEPRIPELTLDGPLTVTGAGLATFILDVTFQSEPYPAQGIAAVEYLLFDAAGDRVAAGDAEPVAPGRWEVRLDAEQVAALGSGANRLEVTVRSEWVALPRFASQVFATVPAREAANAGAGQ